MEKLRVLIVDDEQGMRLGVARALRDFSVQVDDVEGDIGFEVDEAETGEVALEKVTARPPDILLLDLKLPGISGLDVLERLEGKDLEMLTIMITAYASIETAVRATKTGAHDFLPKPFTPAELRNTLRKAARHLMVTRAARRLAEEKRQVRFQFISVLAHELKAPLNAVEGYLYVLKDRSAGDKPEVYEQITERCLTRIEYMRKMIADLLDMTRIESGRKKRELGEVDVVDAARTAIESAMPDAQARGIAIELHGDDDVTHYADRGEVEIVLNNLVSNAVKYNRDGGKVDVHVTRENGATRISVSDTGIGMSEAETAKLFKDFVRIKNEKTRNIMGSGLGLSIVAKIAQLYNGETGVESEPDAGSTFTVVLRQTEAEPAREEAPSAS